MHDDGQVVQYRRNETRLCKLDVGRYKVNKSVQHRSFDILHTPDQSIHTCSVTDARAVWTGLIPSLVRDLWPSETSAYRMACSKTRSS